MTAIQRLVANGNSIVNFLKEFSSDVSQDITIDWVEEDNTITTKSFANIKKFQDSIDIQNTMGMVTTKDGEVLTIDNATRLGGETKTEIIDNLASSLNTTARFKFLADTSRSTPERLMVGLNYNDELVHWGRERYYATGSSDQADDNLGLTIIPQPPEKTLAGIKVKEIKMTNSNLFVLYEDGSLYGNGYNGYGQLGIGNTADQSELTFMTDDVVKIETSSHGYHQDYTTVLVLKGNGEVFGTGKNGYGQLARGTTTDNMTTFEKCQFTSDLKDSDNIIDIYVCDTNVISTYVLTDTGKVFSCGWNGDGGALGLGDTTNRSTFTKVSGLLEDEIVVELSANGGTRNSNTAYYQHSVVVRTASNKLFSWGYNGYGELGLGSTTSQSTPQPVIFDTAIFGNPVEIVGSRGSWTSYMVRTDTNKLIGWGSNNYGYFGMSGAQYTPVVIMEDVAKAWFIDGGGTYSYHLGVYILKLDGTLWSAGQNTKGKLGNNSTSDTPTLTQVRFDTSAGIKQFATGGYSSTGQVYFLLENGKVFGAGDNTYQQIRVYTTKNTCNTLSLIGA